MFGVLFGVLLRVMFVLLVADKFVVIFVVVGDIVQLKLLVLEVVVGVELTEVLELVNDELIVIFDILFDIAELELVEFTELLILATVALVKLLAFVELVKFTTILEFVELLTLLGKVLLDINKLP